MKERFQLVKRRTFLKTGSLMSAGILSGLLLNSCSQKTTGIDSKEVFFKLSLAQWSFHKALFSGELKHLDFAQKTASLGIYGVEYVNRFFGDKAEDAMYLAEMNQRAADADVTQLIIMVDGEGGLGNTDANKRQEAVSNHYKWVNAAKSLGCHSIRVNAYGQGSSEDVAMAAVDGLGALSEYASSENINIIVENHGGYSSDGNWLTGVIKQVDKQNCGTLPDFGNFCVRRKPGSRDCEQEYDRYKGVEEMMPYAKAVSAKSHDFNADGDEINTDFTRMMQIVKNHGYKGYVGIEYEGAQLSEEEGIIATRDLLIKVGKELS